MSRSATPRFPVEQAAAVTEGTTEVLVLAHDSAVRAVGGALRDTLRTLSLEARARAALAAEGVKVARLDVDGDALVAALLRAAHAVAKHLSGGR